MDYFNITQVCSNCLRGEKVFQVGLSLYDDEGRLYQGVQNMECYQFICHFCWKRSSLDFYRFSHPDLIRHLKCLHEYFKKLKKDVDKLDDLINDINLLIKNKNEE